MYMVWEICKFWILQTKIDLKDIEQMVWEICKFWILQTLQKAIDTEEMFERYVNFEFYKQLPLPLRNSMSLRDM